MIRRIDVTGTPSFIPSTSPVTDFSMKLLSAVSYIATTFSCDPSNRPENADIILLTFLYTWCIFMCMRTNIEINDELMNEAMRYSNVNTKKAVVEEALRTFVEVKEKEIRIANYRERLKELTNKLAGLRLRQSPAELLRQDRDNR